LPEYTNTCTLVAGTIYQDSDDVEDQNYRKCNLWGVEDRQF